ncbi:MAG: ATP-binding protein [Kamptonema sp. SIO1D9]|nr:ATP-binding protein [Kamptonema sp. SIO1D9]
MNVTEVLQLVDRLVFKHTEKHLNDLETNVIKGIWQGKTYAEIAGEIDYNSENHIGNVSRGLYKILSQELKALGENEDVNKSNFCWTVERLANSFNLSNSSQQVVGIINNDVDLYINSSNPQNKIASSDQEVNTKEIYYNVTQSPQIISFYGRESELANLSEWLENTNTRLISVLGFTGIGKTALVRQLIDTYKLPFEAIVWKNIKLYSSLDSILTEIVTELSQSDRDKISKTLLNQCLQLFNKKRCLIVLDNVQEIFTENQFSGQYKPEYQGYRIFLQMIAEVQHSSCLLLISQEKCQEMISLDFELYPTHCLELSGLDDSAKLILRDRGLNREESWSQLISLYEGNPKYLQYISTLIKDIFEGKVDEFTQENSVILTEDIKSLLDIVWLRLSDVEKKILLWVVSQEQSISRENIRQSLLLSSNDLINGLQSLNKRFLLTQEESDRQSFTVSSVFKEYLTLYHN